MPSYPFAPPCARVGFFSPFSSPFSVCQKWEVAAWVRGHDCKARKLFFPCAEEAVQIFMPRHAAQVTQYN